MTSEVAALFWGLFFGTLFGVLLTSIGSRGKRAAQPFPKGRLIPPQGGSGTAPPITLSSEFGRAVHRVHSAGIMPSVDVSSC